MKRLLPLAVLLLFVSAPCYAQPPTPEDELKKLKEDLSKLQEEHKRLDDLAKLKAEIARVKEENQHLKDQLSGKKAPPPPEPPKPKLPIPPERWLLGTLTQVVPLKLTGISLQPNNQAGITLEFTKDLEAKDVVALNQAIRGAQPLLSFWFVDRDRVAINVTTRFTLEGEITGRKGEAFRLIIPLPDAEIIKRVDHVEVRGGM